MNVLFLGYKDSQLIDFIREKGDTCIVHTGKINPEFLKEQQIDFLVSYGYRHIIKKEILDILNGKAINLHISYLPYNRGADPNFWSFFEDTPKGVTIHLIDKGLDTGDILVQKEIHFDKDNETLSSTYNKLHKEIQELFKKYWENIKNNRIAPQKQKGNGSFHKLKDLEKYRHILNEGGYNMPINELFKKIKIHENKH
jgi:methionyl-tRNA formyltransferase